MKGMMRRWTMFATAGLLVACSSQPTRAPATISHEGEASYQALPDDQMAHYPLAMGTTSSGAALLDHPAPSYPSDMLASCPAEVRLRALLIVGNDGTVDEVRVDDESGVAPAFAAAVRTAAMGWRFEPLVISHWAADGNAEAHPVDTETKPFSLPYAFRFACHAGRAEATSFPTTGG